MTAPSRRGRGADHSNSSLAIGGEVSDECGRGWIPTTIVQARLQRLLASSGPDHPQVPGLQQTLVSTAERLFIELQAQRAEAQSTLDVANARVEALLESVQQASARNSDQAANFVRLRALQEEAADPVRDLSADPDPVAGDRAAAVLPSVERADLSYAQVPTTPSGPAVLRHSLALAATCWGMFLGMAIAALREWRERSLRTSTDLTEYSGLRFLGHLPVLPAVRRPRAVGAAPAATRTPPATASGQTLPVLSRLRPPVIQVPVTVLHYPDSVYAETLRHVRLAGEATGRALPVTGVTSFHPFDGRSSVAFNLAGQLGIGMHSVLLIDRRQSRPHAQRMLGLDRKPGLTDAVSGGGNWQDMLVGIAKHQLGRAALRAGPGRPFGRPAEPARCWARSRPRRAMAISAASSSTSRRCTPWPRAGRSCTSWRSSSSWPNGAAPRAAMAETALARIPAGIAVAWASSTTA